MKDAKEVFIFCLCIVLLGSVAIGFKVIPKVIEDSRIPVSNINY